MFKMLLILQ